MKLRHIALSALTIAVFGGLALLFAEASQLPSAEVSDEELERARQFHERSRRRASASKPKLETTTSAKIKSEKSIAARSKPDRSKLERSKPNPVLKTRKDDARPSLPVPHDRTFLQRDKLDDGDEKTELDKRMSETNRMYDRRDYEGALIQAKEVLAETPGNVRMLRVVVSSACIMGDEQSAREYYEKLPPRHQRQMDRRCSRYGMKFKETE